MLHQTIQAEGRFAQTAGNRLLVHSQKIVRGMRIKGDAPALQHMTVVRRKNMNRHIEPHSVRGARCATAVNTTYRNSRCEVDDVDARRFERFFRQVPISHKANLMHVQIGGERHAPASDVAADGEHRS